ncbi:MAG: hypothetical protein EHM42_00275 [Planctomycetaceae bacterium]|nr:MAG: hypothetical protein EHM42_00275 [Planctomycetaceae bacterium]
MHGSTRPADQTTGVPAATVAAKRHEGALAVGWIVFQLSAIAMVGWTCVLAYLALTTANPVVVSPEQIARADSVVAARIDRKGKNLVTVERVFKGGLTAGDAIRVVNLPPAPTVPQTDVWLLPLSRFRQDYQVTVLNDQGEVAPVVLVYPADAQAIDQVKKLVPAGSRP